MRKIFEAELASADRCTELTLPATPYAMLDALEKLHLKRNEVPQWLIIQTNIFSKIFDCFEWKGLLTELNALAQQLAQLNEQELAVVEGLALIELDRLDRFILLPQMIDIAYSADCGHFIEGVTTDIGLGRFCSKSEETSDADSFEARKSEWLRLEKIGQEYLQANGGVLTQRGYVQQCKPLRQVYGALDLILKKPDYTILAERADGGRVELPIPAGRAVVDESIQCVDCAAPALIGQTAMLSTLDALARRLTEMDICGKLPKYKAILEATECGDISQASALADRLEQYIFDPNVFDSDMAVEAGYLSLPLTEKELTALRPNVYFHQYEYALMKQAGGRVTEYGYVQPSIGPTQDMEPQTDGLEMTLK